MSISTLCNKQVICVEMGTSIDEVGKLMEEKNIGCVVVIDNEKPCGLVTDRDILIRVINQGLSPAETYVDDIMSELVMTLDEDMGLHEALEKVKGMSVRRFPVTDKNGNLIGIVTLDDIIYLLGKEMSDVASIIKSESATL
ncbi:MAG: CBS domain-containing protein [Candidatus Dadabacteria bacterium]|nr:CBS domain-containing protein [Candidatus Dadabacteria bacterium]NIS08990.1 CBS domain-containing protein [Candidatus Dadabacteria bacterium]NIV41033.1 CBS domain-containing protein [Candidatus Dadabacteria bacterium]NIX15592.1 CBS domain-containing protein [Candidatus Dadabacteria bacterium]NIY22333.1 CBS domain-containing protein [Candidatus Dadabacteria bacterium]